MNTLPLRIAKGIALLLIAIPFLSSHGQRERTLPSDAQIQERVPDSVTFIPNIAYREGNKAWHLDLAMPKERCDSPRPAIVFIHGGGWRNGDKRANGFLNPTIDYAAKGYVCITVNYRMLAEAPLTACIEDVKNAVRWFRAHAEKYNIDPDRIGATGNSAGAHLSVMLGLCSPSAGLEGDGPLSGLLQHGSSSGCQRDTCKLSYSNERTAASPSGTQGSRRTSPRGSGEFASLGIGRVSKEDLSPKLRQRRRASYATFP